MGAMFLRLYFVFILTLCGFTAPVQANGVDHIVTVSHGKTTISVARQIVRAVYRYSSARGLDPAWVFKIMQTESTYNPKARSPSNAVGLMQVIARWHPVETRGRNLTEVDANIDAGTKIIRKYLDQCSNNMRCAMRKYNGSKGDRYYARVNRVILDGSPELDQVGLLDNFPPPIDSNERVNTLALFKTPP